MPGTFRLSRYYPGGRRIWVLSALVGGRRVDVVGGPVSVISEGLRWCERLNRLDVHQLRYYAGQRRFSRYVQAITPVRPRPYFGARRRSGGAA